MNFKNFLKENRAFVIVAIFAIAVFSLYIYQKNEMVKEVLRKSEAEDRKMLDYQATLDTIEAQSFYVYDIVDKKAIFSKDEHLKLPLASITKLMSGLVVLDVMPDTTILTISMEDIATEGDSGLFIGEKWKLKDLLDFSLMTSSNDGMHAIANAINYYQNVNNLDMMKMMNNKAQELGLKDTVFINETGLDIDGTLSGAYSSAYDISILLEKIIKNNPNLISNTSKNTEEFISESNIKHKASNTNISIDEIPGLIASKTGFTGLAGGNLAVVFDAGIAHPVAIVVLGSSASGRFTDVVKLAKISLEKLSE